jgi:hypothetical protein
VTEALRHSTNLVFVRLMRDVAKYYMFQSPGSSASLLADADDPRRASTWPLRRQGRQGIPAPLLRQVQGQAGEELDKILLANIRSTPVRLAVIFRTVYPKARRKSLPPS